MGSLASFRELKCWQEAVALRLKIRAATKQFPPEEKYRLTDQLVRAARSVTANIAEGFGRFHQENIQFCRIARGSLNEILDHVVVALEEGYITQEEFNSLSDNIDKCINIINGYIRYLAKAKNTFTNASEPEIEYALSDT